MKIVNWYGYTIGDNDGEEILAHNMMEAERFIIKSGYASNPDDIEIYEIGTCDADHWESEHIEKAWK